MKLSKPFFFENSKLPIWLSKLAPINISAITLGPFVVSVDEMSDTTKNHETIHWQQYIDLCVIGFPILYFTFWLIGLLKYKNGTMAYIRIPFEQEAYTHQENLEYLQSRKRWSWRHYKI